ncbi:MAG: sodium:solute symporter family protein [Candidatus Aminicenantes bacterium]|nr:sodium:solute symporter family protein [Candidatus Aminicenantes bacterium]
MSIYIAVIFAYLLVLTGFNFYRARRVKSQDDFQVAGRSLKWQVMVFTLICTWIGSGTFISGAEFASKAGFSALWLAAGAWVGIILIYFLAAKIHTFGQYTVGDVLEVRYGPAARLFGAVALILSFISIVSYQFVAGGFILNVITDGRISEATGTFIAAAFVILFTAVGGMVAIAYTDLPNGIIIVLACLLAVPFVVAAAGGPAAAKEALEPGYFAVVNSQFGAHPWLKAIGYFLSTLFLLMGVQSMYQKFYSAKSARDAKKAVAWWTLGTIFVETVVVVIAVFAFSKLQGQIDLSVPKAGGKVVLMAAKQLVPVPIGVLLLGAACAVVISTGMNYLLSPSTTLMRDIYQRFLKRDADPRKMVALQKVLVVVVGLLAFLLATQLKSVLEMSFFAYTIYGVAITPALIAALTWRRATRAGGLISIIAGTVVSVLFFILSKILPASKVPDGDPWGIPLIYPALAASLLGLVLGSLLTPRPKPEEIEKFFPRA